MNVQKEYNINGVNGLRFSFDTNEEWRVERAKSIGASAVGTLIGDNPYQTPMELAERMRAELNGEFDYSQTLPMMRGHAYESGVAALFAWQTGHQIIQSSSADYLLRRTDIPFMHASPDRTYWIDEDGQKHGKMAEVNKGILECKTTMRPIDADNLPLSWIFQLQVQMGISGYHQGYIAWDTLSSRDGFGFRFFEFDATIFQAAIEVCRDFWERCIIGEENPDPVTTRDILARYPRHVEGKTITASKDTVEMIESIREMKTIKKELEEELNTLTDQLKATFTDAEAIVNLDGKVLATYRSSTPRSTVDSKKLKEEYPEAYAACLKEGAASRTLLIK